MRHKRTLMRKFDSVPKTKGGVPKKYVSGAKNPRQGKQK